MFTRWQSQSKRQQRMQDASRVLLHLQEVGSLGVSGLALRRALGLSESRLDKAIKELWEQGLIKEVTCSKPNTWALRRGFVPQHVIKRRWRLTTHGCEVVQHA